MALRATKRGDERTRLERDCDVLICGASFAGLAVARELAGSGAKVLVIDRYDIGERQTSACAMPTLWLEAMDLTSSMRQTFDDLVVHTPWLTRRWPLPWSFSTFDYRELCALMWQQAASPELEFENATVTGRRGTTVQTDRGELTAPLVVDALGWRRVLSNATPIQPPHARLSRGLEVHPPARGSELEIWIDASVVRSGYGWSFPAGDEIRVGVGSFWPEHHVKEPTVQLAARVGVPAEGYQGNWIPHQLRRGVEDGIFFTGDSAGHCLPLTAEGIRTAIYFGLAAGREIRAVIDGRRTREHALSTYGTFSDAHERKYRWMLNVQRAVGRMTPSRAIGAMVRGVSVQSVTSWSFGHYLAIAPPSFVAHGGGGIAPSAWRAPAPGVSMASAGG